MRRYFRVNEGKTKLRSLIMFLYMFLCCLNQYVKLFGIPLFMFLILIYACVKLSNDNFLIRNSLGIINTSLRWHFPFFFIWILVGLLFASVVNNEAAWRSVLYITINTLGYYMVLSDTYYYDNIRKWCYKGLVMGIISNILVSFWELKSGKHIMPLSVDYLRRFTNRPLGFYVNTNDLAIVLIFMLSALFVGYIYSSKSFKRTIAFIGIFLAGCAVIISSRSVISITATICVALFPVLYYQYRAQQKAGYLILLLLFFVGFIFISIKGEELFSIIFLSVEDPAITGRLDIWRTTWDLFKTTVFIGIGPGQNTVIGYGSVHNLFLEIMSEYGLLVGILFISLFVSLLKEVIELNCSFLNSIVVVFAFLFIPLSICSSSMTKLFPIWPCIGLILAYAFKDNKREVLQ